MFLFEKLRENDGRGNIYLYDTRGKSFYEGYKVLSFAITGLHVREIHRILIVERIKQI